VSDDYRQEYLEEYQRRKQRGERFFPDVIFKDQVVVFAVFVVLFLLARYKAPELAAVADPSDSSYTPRPEWYFLFLFQLLKFFPGNIEVVGVVILPGLALAFLLFLPWVDRSRFRHFTQRPVVTGITAALIVGATYLTLQSMLESPPPSEAVAAGDPVALLYAQNCAGCHGAAVAVTATTDLHAVIAAGTHEGMPAWGGDLTGGEIDSLVGYITAPSGLEVFDAQCLACHAPADLVELDLLTVREALTDGTDFAGHAGVDVPSWSETLSSEEFDQLLNYLAAPVGQRLYADNCQSCHGAGLPTEVDGAALEAIIREGGRHRDMPSFGATLTFDEVELLASYVEDPASVAEGPELFAQNCSACHGTQVPSTGSVEQTVAVISTGGSHTTMPVWGEVLTDAQIDALVAFVIESSQGAASGQQIFADNCAACHGLLGEGGVNPARPGDIIAPISSAEYLRTRDDATLYSVISQGQPDFGMSPFGVAFGGPLSDEQVRAVVGYIRGWEEDPPTVLPAGVADVPAATASGDEVFDDLCAQCHASDGSGGVGPALNDPQWQASVSDEELHAEIDRGHPATAMIAWGEILSASQINELVSHIRRLGGAGLAADVTETPTFTADISAIFAADCAACHGSFGGWSGETYRDALLSGDAGPTILPGSADASPLYQSLIGTHPRNVVMPPGGSLDAGDIELIRRWINNGALE
jgi:mono/diheme cytochrome c family protein